MANKKNPLDHSYAKKVVKMKKGGIIKKYDGGGEIDPITGQPILISKPGQSQVILKRSAVPIKKPIARATESFTDPNALVNPGQPFNAITNPWIDKPGKLSTPDYQMTNPTTGTTSSVSPTFYNAYKDISSPNPANDVNVDWTKMQGTGVNDLGLTSQMFNVSPKGKVIPPVKKLGGDVQKGFQNALDKTGQVVNNYGRGIVDVGLSALGMNNVIKDDAYTGAGADFMRSGANIVGNVAKTALPIAANALIPGSEAFVSTGQHALNTMNPENSTAFAHGGEPDDAVINVERDELEVKNGRIVTDYKNKPKHPEDGSINPKGNVEATEGNMIIPSKMRQKYLDGDKLTRATIEMNLKRDQVRRERDEQETAKMFADGGVYIKSDVYGQGGTIHIKPANKGKFTASAKRAGMGVQEYAHHVMKNSSNPVTRKRAQFAINASKWKHEMGGEVQPYGFGGHVIYRSGDRVATNMGGTGRMDRGGYDLTKSFGDNEHNLLSTTQYGFGGTVQDWKNFQNNNVYGANVYAEGGNVNDYWGNQPVGVFGNTNSSMQMMPQKSDNQFAFNDQNMPQMNVPTPNIGVTRNNNVGNMSGAQADKQGQPNNNWQTALTKVGEYAPTAYNLGMGLFNKAQTLNPHDYTVNTKVPYRDVDFSPIARSIEQQGRIANINDVNTSGGSTGSIRSGQQQTSANVATNLADAKMKAQQYNNTNRAQVDMYNTGIDQSNNQMRFGINDYNNKARAAKNAYIGAGVSGVSAITQQEQRNKNLQTSDEMRMKLLSDMFENFSYDKTTGSFKFKGK